ncbi:hypothetical protein [Listeria rocourtiae]|uniref:hypothetical protein n=1 Tax=Listeria rocourtiae TaxID=647910 RepID=UPI001C8A34F2|nr:hypothetical protein [Listeria rocourtiae]
MDILVDSCAGIDIHQKVMVACVLTSPSKGTQPKKYIESFASTTGGLLRWKVQACIGNQFGTFCKTIST